MPPKKGPETVSSRGLSSLEALKATLATQPTAEPKTPAVIEESSVVFPADNISIGEEGAPVKETQKTNPAEELFAERLLRSEVTTEGKETVFRGKEGAYLSKSEMLSLFVSTLKNECGYDNQVANHVCTFYIRPLIESLQTISRKIKNTNDSSSKQELDTERKNIEEAIVAQMRDVATSPEHYGIDLEAQKKPRHELVAGNENYAEELLANLQDIENVPDPLYVNGQLPMPKPLGDACKRIFEMLYPDNDEENTKLTRMLLKEKCVDQLIRELEQAERQQPKTKEGRIEKRKLVDKTVARITQFMREILTTQGVMQYVDAIATGVIQEDLVQFPTITKRPSYNETAVANKTQLGINNFNFYKNLTETYTPTEQLQLVKSFDDEDNSFFRDDAGTKSITHVYFDVRLVLKQSGYDDVTIDTTFLPFIKDLITEMITMKQSVDTEYKKGFGRDQKRIEQYKQDLGILRNTFIKEGKKQIKYAAFFTQIGSGAPTDISSVLVDELNDSRIEEIQAIEFTCSDFDDADSLKDSLAAFAISLEDVLKPLRDGVNANELGKNDDFIKTRDGYTVALQELEKLVTAGGLSNKDAIIKKSKEIVELHTSLVSYYENQVDTNNGE